MLGLALAVVFPAAQLLLRDDRAVALGLEHQPQPALAPQREDQLVAEQSADPERTNIAGRTDRKLLDVGYREADNMLNFLIFLQVFLRAPFSPARAADLVFVRPLRQ